MTYKEIFFPGKTKVKRYNFNPQPDITAYELSLLIPLMLNKYNWGTTDEVKKRLEKMPPEIMRHIDVITDEIH